MNELNGYFNTIKGKVFRDLSFNEMKSLTNSPKELFKCSANIHFKNESLESNSTQITDCFHRFEVLQSIYGNDFGICYTFFAKNYSILLKDNDFIQFVISYENLKMLLQEH